ncbi:hypothetical protein DFJ73DRAFT_796278 [Zopfochytrium polystomum]|nr:hypothetical protein DFJ73DRAFT_801023 [Zopfochytrium polystomum]KAI9349321.1 hypothetical protein DFJ73DRAFT_796278 [Zopfochytrium polystomum]
MLADEARRTETRAAEQEERLAECQGRLGTTDRRNGAHDSKVEALRSENVALKNRPLYTNSAIFVASKSRRISILEWWRASGLELNKILVLQWWKDSGYELKYDPASCIDSVIYRGRVECLQWWKDSRLEWAADAEGRLAGTCIHCLIRIQSRYIVNTDNRAATSGGSGGAGGLGSRTGFDEPREAEQEGLA